MEQTSTLDQPLPMLGQPLPTLDQKVLAEFVGTFALVFITIGAILASGGADGGLVAIAIAPGLAIATMASAVGHISGGHFNPAITIAMFVTGKISLRDAAIYIVTQLAAGVAAAGLIRAAFPEQMWDAVELGTPLVNPLISTGQAVLIEAVLTFFLVWVVFATVIDGAGAFVKIAGLAIGFAVLMGILMGAPFTGGAMNPARALGPALAGGFWDNHWVYWVGPVAGGIVAAVAYDLVILRSREEVVVREEEVVVVTTSTD